MSPAVTGAIKVLEICSDAEDVGMLTADWLPATSVPFIVARVETAARCVKTLEHVSDDVAVTHIAHALER